MSGQETSWHQYKLENIEVHFPLEEVYEQDTIIQNKRIRQMFCYYHNSTLLLQKLPAEQNSFLQQNSILPYDYESLLKYYDGFVEGLVKSSQSLRADKREISMDSLIGYETTIYKTNEDRYMEVRAFLVEKNIIAVSIYNPTEESDIIKTNFFNSLNLANLESKNQFTGTSKEYRQGQLAGKIFIYVLFASVLFFVIRLLRKTKSKSKQEI